MNINQPMDREDSQLFLVRLWAEERNTGNRQRSSYQVEWCGKLQDVVSGHVSYFRGWPMLVDLLQKLAETERAGGRTLEALDYNSSEASE